MKSFTQALLDPVDSLFVCIDIQERLLPVMARKSEVVKNSRATSSSVNKPVALVLFHHQRRVFPQNL